MSGAEAGHHVSPVEPTSLQGQSVIPNDDAGRMEVLEKAFDYRGDCTLALADGTTVSGYIFDRRRAATPAASVVRLLTPTSDTPVVISYDRIARIDFGKDTAAGKSFETWLKKYVDKKLKGERASIESEALD